jgi:hypothetical protein
MQRPVLSLRTISEVGWQASISELESHLFAAPFESARQQEQAAELLGIHRRLLCEKMRDFGIG